MKERRAGAVASSPRRGGLGGVNVSFSSFLCAKEKDRLKGLALFRRCLDCARHDSGGSVGMTGSGRSNSLLFVY